MRAQWEEPGPGAYAAPPCVVRLAPACMLRPKTCCSPPPGPSPYRLCARVCLRRERALLCLTAFDENEAVVGFLCL